MHEYSLSYALLLTIAAGFSLVSAALLWRRWNVPGVTPLFVFFIGLFVWSATYVPYWLVTTSAARLFWLDVTFFGVVIGPTALFVFTLYFAQHERWVTRRFVLLLTIQPILTLVLLWSDPAHGQFFAGTRTAESSTILEGGPWFWVNVVYSYGLIIISYALLVGHYRRVAVPYRQQIVVVLLAFSLPLLGNIISLAGLSPLPDIDLTPLLFTLTGLMLLYALFYKELFDLAPVARDKVMDTIREPVFVVDSRQRLVDINPAAWRLLSETHAHLKGVFIGQPVTLFFPDWPDWLADEDAPGEIKVSLADQQRTYERLLSPLTDRHGSHMGEVLVLNNITRRKLESQREFELALEKERIALLTTFIRSTGHEFRTPLTIINSSAYLMARQDDPIRRASKMAQIAESVTRITRLVEMMIATVELQSRDTLRHESVDVGSILEKVCGNLNEKYGSQPTLECEVSANLPPVLGEPDYLQDAVTHVLDNAFRFTPDDGTISVIAWAEAGEVHLQVRDSGPGMDADILKNAYKTFWRQDSAQSTPGVGLGLPITRRVVELHEGQIVIDSQPGHGTCVHISLPAMCAEPVCPV